MPILIWFLGPIGRYVGGAILLSVVLGGLYLKVKHDGEIDALRKIQEQNARAREEAADAIRDVDACYAADGMWDIRTGKCRVK